MASAITRFPARAGLLDGDLDFLVAELGGIPILSLQVRATSSANLDPVGAGTEEFADGSAHLVATVAR